MQKSPAQKWGSQPKLSLAATAQLIVDHPRPPWAPDADLLQARTEARIAQFLGEILVVCSTHTWRV